MRLFMSRFGVFGETRAGICSVVESFLRARNRVRELEREKERERERERERFVAACM
jgi:hypothetical protein